MQNLSNLSPAAGSHRARKRLGRGAGSGTGKTAGRGHKGQKARKSPGPRPGFEGGQTPLYRRIPKRGFTNRAYQKPLSLVQLSQLATFPQNSEVTVEDLRDKGWVKGHRSRVKVLAGGHLTQALTVHAHAFSRQAQKAIEEAGGSVQVVPYSPPSSRQTTPTSEPTPEQTPARTDTHQLPETSPSSPPLQDTSSDSSFSPHAPSDVSTVTETAGPQETASPSDATPTEPSPSEPANQDSPHDTSH